MRLHATYSGAKYSRVEEGTSSTEEDDWLSSSEDEDDTFRATPPSVNLERRQETVRLSAVKEIDLSSYHKR